MIFSGAVLVLGASGIIAQLLLLRELLITFQSNELTIGLVLANWLVYEAAGAWLGRFIEKVKRRVLLFVAVSSLFFLCLPPAVYLARTWRSMAGAGPGEGMGLHQIFLASLVVLLPVSLTHGALFTFACRIKTGNTEDDATGIGRVYHLETAGTLAGGLIFTWLMATFMNSFAAALLVCFANILICLLLMIHARDLDGGYTEPKGASRLRTGTITGALVLLLTAAAIVSFGRLAPWAHWSSINRQWQHQKVIHYQNSFYGNTAVVEREGQYTFYTSGIPAITAPVPDVAFVEEFAHLPLLLHPRPLDVLVLSGGAGGIINELLKHEVRRIDYAELDPLLLNLVRRFPTDLTEAELGDGKVHVHHVDGRLFLKRTPRSYDVLLVGLSDPKDLQLNRFFTTQFYSLVSSRLKDDGLVAFTLPGSLTYMGDELRDLNACVLNSLRAVFSTVRVIPGDGYNLLLASNSPGLNSCDTVCALERFGGVSPALSYLSPAHIRYRLDPRWSRWFLDSMSGATDRRNEDLRPLGVFYSLSYWNAKFAPTLQKIYSYTEKVSLPHLTAALLLAAAVLIFLVRRARTPLKSGIPMAMASTGFTGMILALALIFTFQALYGVVFYWVGLLVTAFMAGTAAGSLVMTRFMERIRRKVTFFLGIEAALAAFSVTLPFIFLVLEPWLWRPGLTASIQIGFLFLSFAAGLLIGMEFPLASRIYLGFSADVGGTAGLLYGVDLLGGWAGGIAGGVVLLPVIGLAQTCLLLGLLKLASLVLVGSASKGVRV